MSQHYGTILATDYDPIDVLNWAIDKCEKAGETRKDGVTPLWFHWFHAAYIARTVYKVEDVDLIVATFLHDTVEDLEGVHLMEVRDRTNLPVALIVDALTDRPGTRETRRWAKIFKANELFTAQMCIAAACDIHANLHIRNGKRDRYCPDHYMWWALDHMLPTIDRRMETLNVAPEVPRQVDLYKFWHTIDPTRFDCGVPSRERLPELFR